MRYLLIFLVMLNLAYADIPSQMTSTYIVTIPSDKYAFNVTQGTVKIMTPKTVESESCIIIDESNKTVDVKCNEGKL